MTQLKNKTVLVFGEDTRSFLSVIRSLAQAGMTVDTVCFSNTSPALKSKYININFPLNHRSMAINEWTKEIENILIKNEYDVVIPCDERALFPLIDLQQKLSLKTAFAIPNKEIFSPLFDKTATRITAQACDIPVAKGEYLNLNDHSFEQLKNTFNLPLVLKPTQSYAEDQLNKRQSVKIAYNEDDFKEFKQANVNQNTLVESYFPGYGIGVSILASEGKVRAAFAHARVAEPESGGGSSYRKAIPLNPTMLFACQKFCLNLNYTGVAMFEFKFNPKNNDWILIEINARFLGSLPLAIFAGVNFPAMYSSVLLGLKITDKLNYNHNAYARSFTADIYAMKTEFDQIRLNKGLAKAAIQLTKRLASFSRLLTNNDTIDSFQWQDTEPFKLELYDLFKDKVLGLPKIKQYKQKQRIQLFKQQVQNATSSNNHITDILFVCYGNIMRSPFAEKLFVQKVVNTKLKALNVDSYGFHQVENRNAKSACISMAKTWQVNLEQHKSKWIKQHKLNQGKPIVIIFDQNNEHILQSFYSEVIYISLADLIPPKHGFYKEIEDPYGRSEEYLKTCYQLIDASVDELIRILN